MSDAYKEARSRLEAYIAECLLGHDFDLLRLRTLEADLVTAARREVSPF